MCATVKNSLLTKPRNSITGKYLSVSYDAVLMTLLR